MRTADEARKWMDEHREACMENYRKNRDIPDFLRSPRMELVWMSGCWLNTVLKEMGASEKEVHDIGFAQGQRSLFQDPLEVAIEYANEFEANRAVKDKPGIEFADELNDRYLGKPQ
jgi:hypothetical protein